MNTVGEALARWREQHGRTSEEVARVFWVALGPIRVPLPNPGQLHWHDLHHLMLGYEPDLLGEIEISAYELRTGVKTPMVLLLCLAGVLLGMLITPRRTWRAWQRGRGARNLYGCPHSTNEVRGWQLEELRAWMRIC